MGWHYSNLGKFEKALPWLDPALKEAEKGDVHGRVDDESLRITRDAVTECLKKLGRL